jgi:uncharacterized protein YydD (DUF2326 family)
MIILKNIYSETDLFKAVKFIPGINIIQGKYSDVQRENSELNGVGKSTLVRLIDFAFLSDSTRNKHFNVQKNTFLKDHSVTLEFIDDKRTFFLKRYFDNPNKPLFGDDPKSLDEFEYPELKKILGGLFFGRTKYDGYFNNGWFRDLMRFFVKDDVNHFQREDPLNFIDTHASKYEIYSYNFFLLDLPNLAVQKYDQLNKKIIDIKKQKKKWVEKLRNDTGKDIQEFNTEIRLLDDKIRTYEKSIKNYEFLDSYKSVEKELITIAMGINEALAKLTFFQRKLAEYKKSYEFDIEFDKDEVVKIYTELKQIVGDAIEKQLEEVILFRKSLSENRKRFLIKKESELNKEIENLSIKISTFESKRKFLYKLLDEKNALDSIKNTYGLLIEEKTKKENLTTSITQVKSIDQEIYSLNELITKSVSDIAGGIDGAQEKIEKLHLLYYDLITKSISVENKNEIVFDIRPSPEIRSPLNVTIDVPKSGALGKSRFKILAYDLTMFFNIIENKRNLPHFLIHDGVFHGIDIRVVVRILNEIYSKFLVYQNFQYIFTANENEIFIPEAKKPTYGSYKFDLSRNLIATFKDVPDQMIFKREY